MYILAGTDISKINNTVNSSIKKYSFEVTNYTLSEDNYAEITANLDTDNLFGERVLTVVDITETDPELSEKFISKTKEVKDLYILYQKKLDSRTKFAKFLISNKALLYDLKEDLSPFEFGELVLNQKIKESYFEFQKLESKGAEYVSIFSGIVTACRNLMNYIYKTNAKKSIFSNKIGMYQTLSKKFTDEDIKKIYSMLSENDLKFKRGEISEEMLVISSMNYILTYGSNK